MKSCLHISFCLIVTLSLPAFAQPMPAVVIPACNVDQPGNNAFPCGMFVSGNTSAASIADQARQVGLKLRHTYHGMSAVAGRVRDRRVLSALQAGGFTLYPDYPVEVMNSHKVKPPKGGGKNTAAQIVPDGVARIGAAPGQLGLSGDGIGVAIVDTGLDFGHADINVAASCFDAYGGDCNDANGHGTHVGGIVAALNNTTDVVGVAPGATLYAVRVLDSNGRGYESDVVAGLNWVNRNAAANNIRVVNMSLGRIRGDAEVIGLDHPYRLAISNLYSAGIPVVVSAGNDRNREASQMVPASFPEVFAVASTTAADGNNRCRSFGGFIAQDTASYFTTDGAFVNGVGVTISAPGAQKEDINPGCFIRGSGILSLQAGGGTTRMSGTSMAAPHVTGVVALMSEAGRVPDVETARSIIRLYPDRMGSAPEHSPVTGYTFDGEQEGVISACSAVVGSC